MPRIMMLWNIDPRVMANMLSDTEICEVIFCSFSEIYVRPIQKSLGLQFDLCHQNLR